MVYSRTAAVLQGFRTITSGEQTKPGLGPFKICKRRAQALPTEIHSAHLSDADGVREILLLKSALGLGGGGA